VDGIHIIRLNLKNASRAYALIARFNVPHEQKYTHSLLVDSQARVLIHFIRCKLYSWFYSCAFQFIVQRPIPCHPNAQKSADNRSKWRAVTLDSIVSTVYPIRSCFLRRLYRFGSLIQCTTVSRLRKRPKRARTTRCGDISFFSYTLFYEYQFELVSVTVGVILASVIAGGNKNG
jgi:hypothetical protein